MWGSDAFPEDFPRTNSSKYYQIPPIFSAFACGKIGFGPIARQSTSENASASAAVRSTTVATFVLLADRDDDVDDEEEEGKLTKGSGRAIDPLSNIDLRSSS